MNTLTIHGQVFEDDRIADGNLTLFSSVLSDSLEADECVFTLIQGTAARFITADNKRFITADSCVFCVDESFDFGSLAYGDEMVLTQYVDASHSFDRYFYVKEVSRVGKNAYQVVGQSAIGMMANQVFKGDMYAGDMYAGEVIEELFGDFPMSYGLGFNKNQRLYGWIPYTDKRTALQMILFAIGATAKQNVLGDTEIGWPSFDSYPQIPDSLVSMTGSIDLGERISSVELTEYSFFKSEKSEVLFDNSEDGEAADHALIKFDQPCYEIEGTADLEIHESGANYAIISGRGRLTAMLYGSTQNIFTKTVDPTAPENVAKVDSCYLISPANSYNVLERLSGYYADTTTLKMDIAKDVRPGNPYQLTDPFGQTRQGIIEALSAPISNAIKQAATIKCGWAPSDFGNNFTPERRVFLGDPNGGSTSMNWPKPAGVKLLYVALISGGQGGAKGGNGAAGGTAGDTNGGEGGKAGQDGYGGKFNVLRLEVPEAAAQVDLYAGSGGNANGGEGGESTLTFGGVTYSSEDGNESAQGEGWTDVFTGDRYCLDGDILAQIQNLKKYDGAKGGGGSSSSWHHAGYDVAGYTGGAGGANSSYSPKDYFANGGAGGGAANGSNGEAGGAGYAVSTLTSCYGGDGGNGGNGAAGWDAKAYGFGHGGGGGNGGGGGGAGGPFLNDSTVEANRQGAGGAGGQGGAGGKGAPGCCIIYY